MIDIFKFRSEILRYYNIASKFLRIPFRKELEFLETLETPNFVNVVFPYEFVNLFLNQTDPSSVINSDSGLFFKLNEVKIYLPKDWDINQCFSYWKLLQCEQYPESPHHYFTEGFGEILLDIGCAEGNFFASQINQYSEFHLWDNSYYTQCLKETITPLGKNCKFHNDYLDDMNTLDSLIFEGRVSMIKLDVEGAEFNILANGINLITKHRPIINCCTYHNTTDFLRIFQLLDSINYEIQPSKGYMLFPNNTWEPPYFRTGLITAFPKTRR